jgi:hypothetical protein
MEKYNQYSYGRYWPVFDRYWPVLAGIDRYLTGIDRYWPALTGIDRYLTRYGIDTLLYRFRGRYGAFRPFRPVPEWNSQLCFKLSFAGHLLCWTNKNTMPNISDCSISFWKPKAPKLGVPCTGEHSLPDRGEFRPEDDTVASLPKVPAA